MLVGRPLAWALVGVAALLQGAGIWTIQLLAVYWREVWHLDYGTSVLLYGLFGLVLPLFAMAVARPLDHLPARPLIFLGLLGGAACRLVLAAPWATAQPLLPAVFLVMAGLDVLGGTPLLLTLQRILDADAAGPDSPGVGLLHTTVDKKPTHDSDYNIHEGRVISISTSASTFTPSATTFPTITAATTTTTPTPITTTPGPVLPAAEPEAERQAHASRVYAVLYTLMNVVCVGNAVVWDTLRAHFGADDHATANRAALICMAATQVLGTMFLALLWRELGLYETAPRPPARLPPYRPRLGPQTLRQRLRGAWHAARPWLMDAQLWRFSVVCTLLLGVRMVARHMDTTLPELLKRREGEDAPYALVQGVNPLLVAVFTVPLQFLLARVRDYPMLVVGSAVSVASLAVVVVWDTTVWPAVAFVAAFSLGEMLWSVRFTPYALRMAPRERRAVFLALASVPALMAKLPTSLLSAALVDRYCPPPTNGHDTCDTRALWAAILGVGLITPLGLALGARWLSPAEKKRPEGVVGGKNYERV